MGCCQSAAVVDLPVSPTAVCMQARSSEHVDPHKLLNLLPTNGLPHLRALLLERLGSHQEALRWVTLLSLLRLLA